MATGLHRRTTATTITEDNASQPQLEDHRSYFHLVGNGVRETVQLSTSIVQEFQYAVKDILPLLSVDEQNQIREIFKEYHNLLNISQKFLTRSLVLAARAKTATQLMSSIKIEDVEQMSGAVLVILEKFYKLNPILNEKLKDQRGIERLRNIFGLLTAVGLAACSVGIGYGTFSGSGFTKDLTVFLITAGPITGAASIATVVAHVVQHVSELDQVIVILKDIKSGLIQMSQNYSKIQGIIDILSDEDDTKREFIELLKNTQAKVNEGFEFLKKV